MMRLQLDLTAVPVIVAKGLARPAVQETSAVREALVRPSPRRVERTENPRAKAKTKMTTIRERAMAVPTAAESPPSRTAPAMVRATAQAMAQVTAPATAPVMVPETALPAEVGDRTP